MNRDFNFSEHTLLQFKQYADNAFEAFKMMSEATGDNSKTNRDWFREGFLTGGMLPLCNDEGRALFEKIIVESGSEMPENKPQAGIRYDTYNAIADIEDTGLIVSDLVLLAKTNRKSDSDGTYQLVTVVLSKDREANKGELATKGIFILAEIIKQACEDHRKGFHAMARMAFETCLEDEGETLEIARMIAPLLTQEKRQEAIISYERGLLKGKNS